MPKTAESLNSELDNLLSSHGFDVKSLSSNGKEVPVPDEAELFQFHYHKDGDDLGTVTVSIDGNKDMTLYYDDAVTKSGESSNSGTISWFDLVKQLKRFALQRQLTFKLKDTDRLRTDMKRRAHVQQQETALNEGYYGNKKTSYSDDTPTVKMVIKHNKQLEETDQRFRYIDSIFLETSDGERFRAPTTKPSQARMFARHIAEGGLYQDDRWSHLKEMCEDIDTLGGFCRATQKKREQFNESAQRMIAEAQQQYIQLRETAKKLSTSRGYNKYFESYAPKLITETDGDLSEAFMTSTIDSRIERALPVLSKMGISYKAMNEAHMFEQWADDVLGEAFGEQLDEELDATTDPKVEELVALLKDPELKVGPDASNIIGALDDIIEDGKLFRELKKVAAHDPNSDAAPTIISWMQQQDDAHYEEVLAQLDSGATETAPEPEEDESANEEPADVAPVQPEPAPADPNATPPMDPNAMPPMPPLAEDSEFARILKLSGLK
jgi:hypothetical protein